MNKTDSREKLSLLNRGHEEKFLSFETNSVREVEQIFQ